MYPMKRIHQIHNESGEIIPKNSNIFNTYFFQIFTRVIKQRVDKTHLYLFHHGLPYSVKFTAYTTYGGSYLRRVH